MSAWTLRSSPATRIVSEPRSSPSDSRTSSEAHDAVLSFVGMTQEDAARASGHAVVGHFDALEELQGDGLLEALHAARFVEERLVGPERHLLFEQAIAEAGEVEHLQRRVLDAETARELVAGHLRHHDVGDEQVEVLHLRG